LCFARRIYLRPREMRVTRKYSTIKNIPRNILTPRYHQWGNRKELAWAISSALVSCDGSRTTETDSYFLAFHLRDNRVAQVSSQYFGPIVGLWSIRAITSSRTLKACIIWAFQETENWTPIGVLQCHTYSSLIFLYLTAR
jgi:hypothetical protein